MKIIEVDEELYRYIASHTQHIGESASDILRRMLNFKSCSEEAVDETETMQKTEFEPESERSGRLDSLEELLNSADIVSQKKVVDRFITLLSALYSIDPKRFAEATGTLHGRTRLYFAKDQQVLLEHGTHTKPKAIAGTPYWVITNTNSERKRNMIVHIMQSMRFSDELITKACDVI